MVLEKGPFVRKGPSAAQSTWIRIMCLCWSGFMDVGVFGGGGGGRGAALFHRCGK